MPGKIENPMSVIHWIEESLEWQAHYSRFEYRLRGLLSWLAYTKTKGSYGLIIGSGIRVLSGLKSCAHFYFPCVMHWAPKYAASGVFIPLLSRRGTFEGHRKELLLPLHQNRGLYLHTVRRKDHNRNDCAIIVRRRVSIA